MGLVLRPKPGGTLTLQNGERTSVHFVLENRKLKIVIEAPQSIRLHYSEEKSIANEPPDRVE